MRLELSREEVAALVGPELRAALADQIEGARLVSTETAANLLEVSVNTFKTVARDAGLVPVKLGPRVIRWRLAEIAKLGKAETLKGGE